MKTRLFLMTFVLIGQMVSVGDAPAQDPSADTRNLLLGVNAQETSSGLTVRSLIPESAAVGQLQNGDILRFLTADGHPVYSVQTFMHLQKAKEAVGLDTPAYLEVLRNGQRKFFMVVFRTTGTVMGAPEIYEVENPAISVFDSRVRQPQSLTKPTYDPFDVQSQSQWRPLFSPRLQFERLVITKLVSETLDSGKIAILKPRWFEETVSYSYQAEVAKPEVRTRNKMVPRTVEDMGVSKIVEEPAVEEYTVLVPTTEERMGTRTRRKPAEGWERVEVDINAVQAWTVGGQSLTGTELRSELSSARRVFILPEGETTYRYDPYFVTVLGDDVLVMAEPKGLGELPARAVTPMIEQATECFPDAPAPPAEPAPAAPVPAPAAPAPPVVDEA